MSDPRTPERKRPHTRPPRTTHRKWTDDRRHLSHQHASGDDRSRQSSDGADSAATPSSVLINGYPMVKDLSDLSGSYLNGNTAPRGVVRNHAVPGSVYQSDGSDTSYNRPWLLAKILSSREPLHPQPRQDCNDSVGVIRGGKLKQPRVLVMDNCDDQLEVINNSNCTTLSLNSSNESSTNSTGLDHYRSCRVPVLLLLMDPGRKIYELLQIWVDPHLDSVRDVLHSLQMNLGESWRQDYDGVFSVRNNHFSQLIHILPVSKYDVCPYEVWVAKPWSMSAKHTVGYASGVLNHLKASGVLAYSVGTENNLSPGSGNHHHHKGGKVEDSFLVLSKEAIERSYVPGGILKHHHACQFLSFSPPFEAPTAVRVDVLGDETSSQISDGISNVSEVHRRDEHSISHASSTKGGNLSIYPLEQPVKDPNFNLPRVVKPNDSLLRKFTKILGALNCRRRRRRERFDREATERLTLEPADTMIESAVGESLWRLLETDDPTNDDAEALSVVSDTAPLLLSSPGSLSTRRIYLHEQEI